MLNGRQIGFLMAIRPALVSQMAKESGYADGEGLMGGVGDAVRGTKNLAGRAWEGGKELAGKGLEQATGAAETAGSHIGAGIGGAGNAAGSAANYVGAKAKGLGGVIQRGANHVGNAAMNNPKTALAIAILTALGATGAGAYALSGGSKHEQK